MSDEDVDIEIDYDYKPKNGHWPAFRTIGSSCSSGASRQTNWVLDIPDLDNVRPYQPPALPSSPVPVSRVLHLSDLHLQLNYSVGAPVDCGYPICCLPGLGSSEVETGPGAEHWGEYSCDLPPWTLDATLKHIVATQPHLDYVLLTGDLPAHDVWLQSQTNNVHSIQVVAAALRKYFPHIPVLPAIGNHESFPVNMFPSLPGEESSLWLYSSMAKYFSHWLPASARQMMATAGYFSYKVRPGLTIISLNSNFCNNLNLWLLPSPRDPTSQLVWLYHQLREAEMSGVKAHIITHIPPGSSNCLNAWSHQYTRIIERFSTVVTAQFYGHTHYDEFTVFFNTSSSWQPINIGYLGPSLTPHDGLNPSYRVYLTDSERENGTQAVLDHQTYSLDLREANRNRTGLTFSLEYSALSSLGLTDLSPYSWARYAESLATNDTEWKLFYQRYSRYGEFSSHPCNRGCRQDILCRLVTFRSGDDLQCRHVRALVRQEEEFDLLAEDEEDDDWWDEDF